jgi:hypothetical protein
MRHKIRDVLASKVGRPTSTVLSKQDDWNAEYGSEGPHGSCRLDLIVNNVGLYYDYCKRLPLLADDCTLNAHL